MHFAHLASALPAPCSRRAASWLRLLGAAACAGVLAGCAGTEPRGQAQTDVPGISPQEMEWIAASDDPIGELVTHQRNRGRPPQAGRTAPDSALIGAALSQLGVRYRYGGSSPETGFDCSGLVAYSAEQSLGLKLPRNAAEIAGWGTSVARGELRPGDLVFFNTMGRRYSHVGIYMGADRFVHSPSAGGVVRVEDMKMAYWAKRYNGARRLDFASLASAGNP